jgi:predicted nucleic acid-binding protein
MVELLLRSSKGLTVRHRISQTDLHAPCLIDVEVAHVLRRHLRMQVIDSARVIAALDIYCNLQITRYPHEGFIRRIWALRGNLSAYDAAYVSLAEALRVPLVTCDTRLGSAPGHNASVEVI